MRELVDAVAAATREAGALALSRWRGEFKSWDKLPGDIVSEVDLAVNDLLRERLTALDPHAGWLSEETADSPERLSKRRAWIVDPIDGTRDFVRGRPGWCVSVALVEDGLSRIGVLDAPARDEHWLAVRGAGATLNGETLYASSRTDLHGARVPADALSKADQKIFEIVAKPNSIALRMALVAADRADLLASQRWGSEWDIAAAALIVEEAGARVTDAHGVPLRFNQPRAQQYGVLASAPAIHAAAVARLLKA
ncbi:Fructose-1, 6-bisphosphatase/inositol-1-monophosphatase [Sphingomonas antarctica]|uniref:inositol monophosphatase family protein n=1 Tax=Sphingomonas antarctica TaxID=2040274 RepID=UPI0039EAC47A